MTANRKNDASSNNEYLIPLMLPREKREFYILVAWWLVALGYFWWWWFTPEHNVDGRRFAINTILLLWATLSPAYFVFILARARKPDLSSPAPHFQRVAMIVTKAPSEPFSVVKKTLAAMLAQDYPHDTWLADEDPTAEVREWCERHQVRISTRKGVAEYHAPQWPRRTKCKEGNLAYFYDNYGYDHYDFVVQLDADHVPSDNYLKEMLRPFQNPRVGYVSAPSICDSNAQESWSARSRLYVEGAFHGPMQAGHNGGMAPLCIGSHYAVRTKALKEIGGLGPELAEDHSTTLIMNAHGWRGVHAFEAIARGEGPPTFAALATQEFQWSKSLGVLLLKYTDQYLRRLSWPLKLQFLFSQMWYPLFSVTMAASILLPIQALLSARIWVAVSYIDFLWHISWIIASLIAIMYWVKSKGWFRPYDAKVLSWEGFIFVFARWPWSLAGFISAVLECLRERITVFRVTPKGETADVPAELNLVAPYLGISTLCALPALLVAAPGNAAGFYLLTLWNSVLYLAVAAIIIIGQEVEKLPRFPLILRLFWNGQKRRNAMFVVCALIVFASIGLRVREGTTALLWGWTLAPNRSDYILTEDETSKASTVEGQLRAECQGEIE